MKRVDELQKKYPTIPRDVFGWGHVGTNMPPGVTVMAANGHTT